MRIEISSRITAPPMRSDTSDRCSAVRKWRPKNMKISSSTKAIAHSRITMRGRRDGGTGLSTLANSGTLPNGSVTSSSRIKSGKILGHGIPKWKEKREPKLPFECTTRFSLSRLAAASDGTYQAQASQQHGVGFWFRNCGNIVGIGL
jgi:hypothetical protein